MECKADASGADVPNAKKPLADPEKFVSWLEASTSGRTLPPHPTVRSIAVRGSTGTGGYVATLVPKSNRAPHQVIGEDKYYIRSGSSFSAAPHGVLAGLFGRRPQPTVWVTYHAEPPTAKAAKLFAELGIVLHNDGPGIAEDMYCTLSFGTHPGEITVGPSDVRLWRTWSYLGCRWATIATREFLLPPDTEAQPFTLKLVMDTQGVRPMHICGVVGARDAAPFHFEFNSTLEDVQRVYDELCGAPHRVTPTHEHVNRLFGIKGDASAE